MALHALRGARGARGTLLRAARMLSTAPGGHGPGSTHFGFREVPLADKGRMVRDVFESVAPSYDVMNDVMSAGVHRVWKDAFVADLRPTPAMAVLDCAGGTADVAMRVLAARGGDGVPVTVCDVNPAMLEVGRTRAGARGLGDALSFVEGDAEGLSFGDARFDAYLISFGMRNVPRPALALEEAFRVLKPGGRFMMLEFASVSNPILASLYDAYSFNVIPAIGRVVAGDGDSYKYLVESIRQFPNQTEFAAMMRAAGFHTVTVTDYSLGIAACYSGFKPVAS